MIACRPVQCHQWCQFAFRQLSGGIKYHSQLPGISSPLLRRAESLAIEHRKLSHQIQNEYDGNITKRIGELAPISKAWEQWHSANKSIKELQEILQDPTTDPELHPIATEEIEQSSLHLPKYFNALQSSLIPPDPFASLPCLLEIRPGAGGSEASLFVADLLRMYQAYCKRHTLHYTLIKLDAETASKASSAGINEAILEIDTPGAYDLLKCEAGVHRVQRVPATETQGRTHTSAASVLVLPSFADQEADAAGSAEYGTDDPTSDFYINPSDVRTDVMRARGAGGQHVNTTDSAIRLTHIPTSTTVSIQDGRSQHKNRQKAWRVLRSKMAQMRREAREEEKAALRVSVIGVARMGRGDKIRTYNWGQQRVTDHRSGMTVGRLGDVLEGGESLDGVMESVRVWQRERDVEALVADEEAEAKRKGGGRNKASS
ncbi:MAG: hypothetical protein L6R42_003920 [Xanthoria sp. 1 TBL-2021]|nr:MAG: hypothetical protein L6R42_003920 [Xanthoria sp. 1 TBL-2021]